MGDFAIYGHRFPGVVSGNEVNLARIDRNVKGNAILQEYRSVE